MSKERPPLEEMTLRQLRRVASECGVSRYSRMRKDQLLAAIQTIQAAQGTQGTQGTQGIQPVEAPMAAPTAHLELPPQEEVEAAKFDVGQDDRTGGDLAAVDEGLADLPVGYGESQIVLLPRDPQWAYAYWDIPNDQKEELRRQGGQQLALRIYDVTDMDLGYQSPHSIQEYPCDELAREWYLPIPVSDRDYVIEIGYRCADGRWLVLARSEVVRIPPIYPSDWIEDSFLTIAWEEELEGKTFLELVPPSRRMAAVGNAIYDQIFSMSESAEAKRMAGSIFGSMHQVPAGSEQQVAGSIQHVPGSGQQAVSSYVLASGAGMWAGAPTESGVGMSGVGMSGSGISERMSGVGMSGVGMSERMSGIGVTMSGVGLTTSGAAISERMSGVGMSGVGISERMSGVGLTMSGVGMSEQMSGVGMGMSGIGMTMSGAGISERMSGVGMTMSGAGISERMSGVGMTMSGVGMGMSGAGISERMSGVGMTMSGVGMGMSGVGMTMSGAGISERMSGVGMTMSGVGMTMSGVGMTMSGIGIPGLTMSGAGLTMSGVGMTMSGVGMGMSGVGMTMSGVGMSGVGFSGSLPVIRPRQFWLIADAELIVYGATEPDATVTIGGRPVKLNPDGTFRFQMSFQDGLIDFPIMAVAVDGEQTREIHMKFVRETPARRTNTKEEAVQEWLE
ncbi:DUF4912 domain-containing protein [Pantanalinema sp. GBBB05]|uniref:DUF4912 domain-containing protein n=1 Tax=Pantanalinema sp. GBBB05 TaxID=2604139 RepID=UPI001D9CF197|nr:DUF4912 domain-containing protein [Pantanalinema sp. GBBB05]